MKIMFPLTKPAIATLAIFVFVGNWSSFLWPLVVIEDEKKYTLQYQLYTLAALKMRKEAYSYCYRLIQA